MTALVERPLGDDEDLRRLGASSAESATPVRDVDDAELPPEEAQDEGRPPVNPLSAAGAAFLSTAAVGWMIGGAFVGVLPRLVGVLGALIGAGLVALSYRVRSTSLVQAVALPVAIGVGVLLMLPAAGGVALPTLVVRAVKAGGLSQPPAPFDAGWRFILVVFACGLAVAASVAAIAFNRSRLAVFLPAPVVAAGVLLQPPGKELLGVAPALALVVGGLAVAFGGELSRDSETGSSFETRRLAKAGGLVVVIMAAVVGLGQLGFLYPPTDDSSVIPPKKPGTPPHSTDDSVLFTVKASVNTPLRTGILDVYDGTAWLTSPYDPKRYLTVKDGALPAFSPDRSSGYDTPQTVPAQTATAEITIAKPGPGREVPDLSNTVSATGLPGGSQFDPRSQTLRLPGEAKTGISYSVTAAVPPDGAMLDKATELTDTKLAEFTQVPAAPPAVQTLLDSIPSGLNPYERLQFVRTAFYSQITAAGAGDPVDVPPSRVQEFLTGTDASPYEITATEVLLARWAGVPARIGYGYYNEDATPDANGVTQVRPSDGAAWLEAYFDNTGWTPILGKPPKAQSSLDDQNKKDDKSILSNGQITAQLYIPIKLQGLSLLYTLVRFYLARVAAVLGVLVFVFIVLPGMLKYYRRLRRRRWALQTGPRERVAAAYAEIRDRAIDFNIGHPTLTPLEFLDVLEPDEQHTQLAWLVTRSIWGDLRRDLREQDAQAAEDLARSLYRRLVGAQPFLTRVIAFGSRVSLRDPWEPTLPNPYWKRSPAAVVSGYVRRTVRSGWRTVRPFLRLRLPALLSRSGAAVIVCLFLLSGCASQLDLTSRGPVATLPSVPATVGPFSFEATPVGDTQFDRYRDVSLIQDYGFFVVRQDNVAVGTLQTASFKAGLRSQNHKVREGVLTSLGGTPKVTKVAGQLFYTVKVNQLQLVVWFPPDGLTYQLVAATGDLKDPTAMFLQLIAAEQGLTPASVSSQDGAAPTDGRRTAP